MSDICELVSFQILTPSHYQFSIFSQRIWRCLELVRLPTHKFHISVDCWILVIEMLIFLKESVGPITNSQICHISVDTCHCWYFWRCPELARLPTHKFVNFSWLLNTCHWIGRCPELARLPTHKFVTFQLTAEYLSLNWWYFWRCPELARLPTHKFITFQLTAEYLSWIGDIFDGVRSWPDYQLTNLSHFSWLVITCYWIGDIFEGVRIWLDNQVSILSHWSWLVITLH